MVEVIQADRDAAADYMAAISALKGEYDPVSMAFMDSICDDMPIVQAFARHRLASAPATDVLAVARDALEDVRNWMVEERQRAGGSELVRWIRRTTAIDIALAKLGGGDAVG